MRTELACHGQDCTFNDILETIFVASQYDINCVSLPSGFMSRVNDFLNDQTFSAAIDYPYGLNTTQVRLHEIILAIRQGASSIDLMLNNGYVAERNWSRIKKDLKSCLSVCRQDDVELRPIIEYRLFDVETVLSLCAVLDTLGIERIINSTGCIVDDFHDNAVISYQIQRKTSLSVVYGGPVLNNDHYEILQKMKIHAVRFTSRKIAENILSNGV